MANYENTQDLKQEVLRHAGELTDGTSEYNDTAIIFINRAQHAILSGGADLGLDIGQSWAWAKNPYPSVLIVQPMIRNMVASAVYGSNVITLLTPYLTSLKDYFITFADDKQAYRIRDHAAGASVAMLDSAYIGTTIVNSATRLMKYDYQLDPGILRLIGPFNTTSNTSLNWDGKIELIDKVSFDRDYPMTVREGTPDRLTQVYKTNDMQPTVRFNRIPASQDSAIRIEYDYIPVPDDLIDDPQSIPLVPRDHRVTLAYYAAYYLLLDKNDNRAAEYRELARAGMMAMVRASKVEKANTNENYGRFISRANYLSWGRWFR